MNIYMDIHNIIYLFIALLMIYIFLFNLIKYNKIIEGVTVNNNEIEMVYNQQSEIDELTTKKNNIEEKIKEIELELKSTNSMVKGKSKKIQKNLRKSEEKLEETGVKQ